MLDFSKYFLMQEESVAEYVKVKTEYFNQDSKLTAKEIGDGNLNYVFRVMDPETGRSLIVKQAHDQLRITKEMHLTTDRNRIESEILQIYNETVPGLTPKLYCYDTIMCACIMEDLKEYRLMRQALMNFEIFPHFAKDIARFMARSLLMTSDVVMEHKAKKELCKHFCNPELCEITEDLVFTEPYNDRMHRNLVFPPNAEFIRRELYEDKQLHLAAAELKFGFMNNAQALLHGDLHTGSLFVNPDTTKVFDPEFAFYGPMGYDVGNVIANLLFAWARGNAMGQTEFCQWILSCIQETVDHFKSEFLSLFHEKATEQMARTPGYAEKYLDDVMSDTAGYAGTELIRRIAGMAQVKDITTIPDESNRVKAERILVLTGKRFMSERRRISCGKDFTDCLNSMASAVQ